MAGPVNTPPRRASIRWLLLAVVAVLAAGGIGGTLLWRQATAPVVLPAEGVRVRIESGWSMREVARRLEQSGVVHRGWALRALARWSGVDRDIHAGDFHFSGTIGLGEVLARLRAPVTTDGLVTIPEGRSAEEVMELLAAAGLGGRDVFECVARSPEWLREMDLPRTGVEGYLFPDTYAFTRGMPPGEILRAMVEHYREQAARLSEDRVRIGLSEHEMVTLASLIEKETGSAEERPLISAVFHNRLRRGMPLQSDPTAVYGRHHFRGPITRADLDLPSAYNTYQINGLPPGPICNPGLASLEAAVHPAAVDYLYFVSRNDGTHEFSVTFAEHDRAVGRYQRSRHGT